MLAMVDHAFTLNPLEIQGKRVVELGCGTGRNVPMLLSSGAKSYVGFDQSPGMLEKATKKYPDLKFVSADIQKQIPVEDQSADLVLVTLVFEHIPLLLSTLTEAYRILAPNGELRVLEIHSDLVTQGTRAHFKHEGQEIKLPAFAHDSEEWQTTLKRAGFSATSIKSLFADSAAIKKCSKLSKHENRSVLFDITARKS